MHYIQCICLINVIRKKRIEYEPKIKAYLKSDRHFTTRCPPIVPGAKYLNKMWRNTHVFNMNTRFLGEQLQVSVLQWTIFGCQELARPHEIGDTWKG